MFSPNSKIVSSKYRYFSSTGWFSQNLCILEDVTAKFKHFRGCGNPSDDNSV